MSECQYPVARTFTEGGEWVSVDRGWVPIGNFFAIKYANGAIWDKVYGWRKHIRIRVKMGRAVV